MICDPRENEQAKLRRQRRRELERAKELLVEVDALIAWLQAKADQAGDESGYEGWLPEADQWREESGPDDWKGEP